MLIMHKIKLPCSSIRVVSSEMKFHVIKMMTTCDMLFLNYNLYLFLSYIPFVFFWFSRAPPQVFVQISSWSSSPRSPSPQSTTCLAPGSGLATFRWINDQWQEKHSSRPSGLVQAMSWHMYWTHIALSESMSSIIQQGTSLGLCSTFPSP